MWNFRPVLDVRALSKANSQNAFIYCSSERPRTAQCQRKQCLVTTSSDKYQDILKVVFTGFSVSRLILGEYFDQIQNSTTYIEKCWKGEG